MNYEKVSEELKKYAPFFSYRYTEHSSISDIRQGLIYLIDAMRLPLTLLSTGEQAEAFFLNIIYDQYLSDEQSGLIGRIPPNHAYQHLSWIYKRIHFISNSFWIRKRMIISDLQSLLFCDGNQRLKIMSDIYRDICMYVSECSNVRDRKSVKNFLSAVSSILWYYTNIERGDRNVDLIQQTCKAARAGETGTTNANQ